MALHSLGNGDNTLFCEDSWHNLGILKDKFPQQYKYGTTLNMRAKVTYVIHNCKWCIPINFSHNLAFIWETIDTIEYDINVDDQVVWVVAIKDGSLRVKGGYGAIARKWDRVPIAAISGCVKRQCILEHELQAVLRGFRDGYQAYSP
ncbi:hypothetical protein GIB67_010973 [Kingdonia uniflora]|uniref:RNase H type-1 domain-containing protein n=1 Tax=Kingdonia uniflora TaxID=39325 RepID=A0A7J7MM95_9MAGN|nr:hypothetical protein GIB67_010973 [Kingdonia uniflora]